MSPAFHPLALLAFCAAVAGAAPIPKAVDAPALNLQHYLEYQADGDVALSCSETKNVFRCESRDQKIVESDANGTTVTSFEKAEVLFNGAVAPVLQKAHFDAVMKELEQTQQLRRKYLASQKPYIAPPSSPLQDALDRALVSNLEQMHVDGLAVESSDPETRLSVKKLSYVNAMKRTAKGVAFSERILGRIDLTYTDALVDANDTDSLYRTLPRMLENWLGGGDAARADYVGDKLNTLYAQQMRSPLSGSFTLKTRYLGNDAIGVELSAESANKAGAQSTFAFAGELRSASTLFPPARKPATPGTPDFLFSSLYSHNVSDDGGYRALLKSDKRFAAYIGQYDTLLHGYFDKQIRKFGYNAVIVGWLEQAKTALSKSLLGKADTLDLSIKNRDGTTAMQLLGLLMEQLIVTQPAQNAREPDTEKIIADTAASHLEIKIEAH